MSLKSAPEKFNETAEQRRNRSHFSNREWLHSLPTGEPRRWHQAVYASDLTGAKRLPFLAAQLIPPAPAAGSHSIYRNGALARVPPLDSRATRASGPILR
jgi:hypothetical protein